tara:strand:- start:23597 stop:26143 length:2547 start_codon:yes stop_codon:yes gene_type:complete
VSYILTESDFKYLPRLTAQLQRSQRLFEKEFAWALDERTSLIVTSNKNQVANAFATISPNNMVVFLKGGVDFLESSATPSWIDTLSSHEVAHVYQLNAKNQLGSLLKKIFGNQIYIPIPLLPWPIFISPTAMLPTFIVEGNAVLNESRLNQGGRLLSGESLVLVSELIHSDKADMKYLMNVNLEFPFGTEKYILGGFFQSYLADRYDFATLNRFFIHHAENNINPFDLKSSFAATFFADYEKLYQEFLDSVRARQKNYNAYRGNSLTTSLAAVEFKRIDDTIYFLSISDGKTPNTLNQFHVSSRILITERSYLKSGRIYRVDNKLYTATSYSQNERNIFFSLVDEDYNFNPLFNNKYVTDIEGTHVSYFDMNQSFDRGVLYRDQEKIAETESKALLDKEGNIYYFKQEDGLKALYKNHDKLTFFESYYALLTDVINSDEIYFISNSQNGASLFCHCNGQTTRVLPYDNVMSAMKANNGFLVSFLNGDRYHIAFIEDATTSDQRPFNIRAQLSSEYFKSHVPIEETPITEKPKPYLSFSELRFSEYSMNFVYSKSHTTMLNTLNWIDPLFYSSISATFSLSNKLAYNQLEFQYSPYATKFYLSGTNETEFYFDETEKITTNSYRFTMENTLLDKRYSTLKVGLDFQGDSNKFFRNDISTAYATYQYYESYFLNYRPYTYFSFTPSLEKSAGSTSQSYSIHAGKKLFYDLYLSLGLSKNNSEYFKLEAAPETHGFFKRGLKTPVYYSTLYTNDISQGDLELLYEIPYSKYYYRFPISVRRLAPFAGYQKSHSKEFFYRTEIDDISFATLGLEAELLLFHTNPTRVRLLSTEITIEDKSETRFGLEIKTSF